MCHTLTFAAVHTAPVAAGHTIFFPFISLTKHNVVRLLIHKKAKLHGSLRPICINLCYANCEEKIGENQVLAYLVGKIAKFVESNQINIGETPIRTRTSVGREE